MLLFESISRLVREDAGDHSLGQDGKQSICIMSPQFTLHGCVRVGGTVNTTEKELVLLKWNSKEDLLLNVEFHFLAFIFFL